MATKDATDAGKTLGFDHVNIIHRRCRPRGRLTQTRPRRRPMFLWLEEDTASFTAIAPSASEVNFTSSFDVSGSVSLATGVSSHLARPQRLVSSRSPPVWSRSPWRLVSSGLARPRRLVSSRVDVGYCWWQFTPLPT